MRIIVTILCLSLASITYAQTINGEDSRVEFSVSNMGFKTVPGTFSGLEGKIMFDQGDVSQSSFEVCIDASSINTENKKRDDHLRTADFFDVERYPTICFTSSSIEKTSDAYTTSGTLTMHGVSKKVDIPFTFEGGKFVGELTLQRLDYKVGEGTGGFMVGKEIEVKIICSVQ